MSTPDRPAREALSDRLATFTFLEVAEQDAIIDGLLDNLALVLEAAREAGKARCLAFEDYSGDEFDMWRLVGLPVQNEPDQEQ